MSRTTRAMFPAALLLACTVRPLGETATDGSGTTGTTSGGTGTSASDPVTSASPTDSGPPTSTSGPVTTTASTVSTSTGAVTTTTGGSFIIPSDMTIHDGCDVWTEDCPEGMKCMPVSLDGDSAWESLRCVPIAPNPDDVNEPCELLGTGLDGLDTCDMHAMCWNVDPDTGQGTCLGMCTGNPGAPGCVDPGAFCQIFNDGVLILCHPVCDPIASDCPEGDVCIPAASGDNFLCAPSNGQGQAFEECQFSATCAPGFVCLHSSFAPECDPNDDACCLPFCDITQPNTCPGMSLECTPWFEQGEAPAGLENIGVCAML